MTPAEQGTEESTIDLTRRTATIGGLGLLGGTVLAPNAGAQLIDGIVGLAEGLDEFWLATDAYVYGYPLVTMEMTRRVMTNVAKPEGTRAPMGQIIKLRQYPDATFRDVTAPNAIRSIPPPSSMSARSPGCSASPT